MRRIVVFFCCMLGVFVAIFILDELKQGIPFPRGISYGITSYYHFVFLISFIPLCLAFSLYRLRSAIVLYILYYFCISILIWPGLNKHFAIGSVGIVFVAILAMAIASLLSRQTSTIDNPSIFSIVFGHILVLIATILPFSGLYSFALFFGRGPFATIIAMALAFLVTIAMSSIPPGLPMLHTVLRRSFLGSVMIAFLWLALDDFRSQEDLVTTFISLPLLTSLYVAQLTLLLPLRRPERPSDVSYWRKGPKSDTWASDPASH
jgi:hypothetical protein